MPFDASDIDIFVLTYNRADFLPATLRSLLAQSVDGAIITILDNASTDATEAVIQPFIAAGVSYERFTSNQGPTGNFLRAQTMARRAWTLVFHDDDLLHPRYLEYALKAINSIPHLSLLASAMSFELIPAEDCWPSAPPEQVVCKGEGLAALLYAGFPLHFGSAIYRTDVFRSLKWEGDLYGKIADRPFLLAAADRHSALVFIDPLVRYRIHAGQDSVTSDSGPFSPQLAALHRCYRLHMGESLLSSHGRTFLRHNYRAIRDEFPRLSKADKGRFASLQHYLSFMVAEGGSSWFAIAMGRIVTAVNVLWRRLGGVR